MLSYLNASIFIVPSIKPMSSPFTAQTAENWKQEALAVIPKHAQKRFAIQWLGSYMQVDGFVSTDAYMRYICMYPSNKLESFWMWPHREGVYFVIFNTRDPIDANKKLKHVLELCAQR